MESIICATIALVLLVIGLIGLPGCGKQPTLMPPPVTTRTSAGTPSHLTAPLIAEYADFLTVNDANGNQSEDSRSQPVAFNLDNSGNVAGGSNGDSSLPESMNGYSIPRDMGGLPVIFVQTPENTRGLQPGEVRLVVQDTAATLKESTSKGTVARYLSNHPLPEGWLVYVVGGPNTSKAEYEKRHAETNNLYDKLGPLPKLGPSSSTISDSIAAHFE